MYCFDKMKETFMIYKKTAQVITILFVILVLTIMTLKVMKDLQILDQNDNKVTDQKTITVSGKGEELVTPDIATISLGMEKEGTTVSDAQSKVTLKMNAVMDVLTTAGIDKKDIKTTGYNIYPRYDYIKATSPDSSVYYPNGKQILAGYVVSQTIEVKIRDIAKAGDILAKVGDIGLTNVSGLSFSVDKEDDFKLKARGTAIDDAKAQAKILSGQLGVRLGRLVSFSENGNYPTYARADMMKSYAPMVAGAAPEISTGENKITSNVTLVYEIK